MSTKSKVILAIIVLVVAFAFGRYSVPEKIVTVTKTIEVEKKVVDTEKDKKIVKVIIEHPDGTKETREEIVENEKTHSTEDSITKSKNTTEITKGGSKINVSILAGSNLSSLNLNSIPITYGASVNKEILGPITVGIFGLSNGNLGISAGLNF